MICCAKKQKNTETSKLVKKCEEGIPLFPSYPVRTGTDGIGGYDASYHNNPTSAASSGIPRRGASATNIYCCCRVWRSASNRLRRISPTTAEITLLNCSTGTAYCGWLRTLCTGMLPNIKSFRMLILIRERSYIFRLHTEWYRIRWCKELVPGPKAVWLHALREGSHFINTQQVDNRTL